LNWLAQGGSTGAGGMRDGLVGGLTYSVEGESCAGEKEAHTAYEERNHAVGGVVAVWEKRISSASVLCLLVESWAHIC